MEINKNFDILKSCRFCPMCRHVCASGNISQAESDFPRGRAMMLYGIHKGSLQYSKDIADALYNCFLCGCCWDHCESHYDLPKLISASRIDMVATGTAPKEAYEIRDSMLAFGNPYGIEDVKPYSFRDQSKKGSEVLYYRGYDINYFDHKIADAAIKIFQALDIPFTLIDQEEDCGKVFSLLGFMKESGEAAKKLYAQIQEVRPKKIVVSDPLVYDCLKNDFKELGLNLVQETEVLHLSEFLASHIDQIQFKKSPDPIMLVDSEYLGRFHDVFEAPRKVLKEIAGDAFSELMENEEMQLATGEAALIFRHEKFGAGKFLAQKICDLAKERALSELVTLSPTTKKYLNESTGCKAEDFAEFVAGKIDR